MKMSVLLFFVIVLCCGSILAEDIDTATVADTNVVELESTIFVVGQRITTATTRFPFEKDRLNQVLTENGFGLISKGAFLAQDIQADGFKRDDITIVVDGERYHSACPNRMDSPLARSNSLEMSSIDLNKTSSSISSGLSGVIAYNRDPIGPGRKLRVGGSQSVGASEATDIGFAATGSMHRMAGRYAVGKGYEDADGRDFVELYGYKENYTYSLAEGSITGVKSDWKYRAEFTYTEDVMFPYLQMDERTNEVYAGSVAYKGHKLYVNHTSHLMDGDLRVSMGSMVTDATNTTVGLNGSMYDVYYRHWNADNQISTPMTTIENHLMPEVNQIAGSIYQNWSTGPFTYWGRLGVSNFSIGDKDRESFYEVVHGEQSSTRTFPIGAVGGAFRSNLTPALKGTLVADLTTDPPPAQSMYIAVRKPMGKPWWSGNPGLNAPVRASLRGKLAMRGVTFEASASHVWDYVNFQAVTVDAQAYQTYHNVNAVLLSVGLRGNWKYVQFSSGYTWAERYDDDMPLSEVPPFYLTYTLKSPKVGDGAAFVRHTYNDAQTRVNTELKETPTGSWHRFDIGLNYDVGPARFGLEVDNVLDELYTQHMSYLRNPFSSGARVYEPGLTLRLNMVLLTTGE